MSSQKKLLFDIYGKRIIEKHPFSDKITYITGDVNPTITIKKEPDFLQSEIEKVRNDSLRYIHSNDFLKRRRVEYHKRQIKNDRKNRKRHKRNNSNNKARLVIISDDKNKVTGSKGEIKVRAFLKENNIVYNPEHIFIDCINPKTNKELVFDFYLPNKNICIEYDGIQHFEITPDFFNHSIEEAKKGLIEQQHRDLLKTKYCEQKGIKLIRIPYTEYKSIRNILATGL